MKLHTLRGLKRAVASLALAALTVAAPHAEDKIVVDAKLTDYAKTSGISGNLSSIGSDTLNNLMTLWAETFRGYYPSVNIQIEGKGSSTAPPALIQGTAQLGPMSRPMKSDEIAEFEAKYGYKPTAVGVALDALEVFVNKDNPLTELTMPQVDAIFSQTRKGGYAEDVTNWGQLGLEGEWANRPISLFGRNSASGTYGYFKEHALFKGDYKNSVKEQPGSASVVQGVSEDVSAIGYSGVGYRTSGVKGLNLAAKEGQPAYEPNYENVLAGKYPLSRMLYVYVAKDPNKPLDPNVREFLKMVLTKQGQEIVVKDGYLPLPAVLAEKELKKLE